MGHPTNRERFETFARQRTFMPNGPYPDTVIVNWCGKEGEQEWTYEHRLIQLLWECWNNGYDHGSEDMW